MLTGITLENFKAFKAPQYIPIKPVTLVFGPNSAGKSSIIHALAFLKHVYLTKGHCNPGRVNLGWAEIELSSWRNLVHRHDVDATMRIGLHSGAKSIEWSFRNDESGPHVASFEIRENDLAKARGMNEGGAKIQWDVELHSTHYFWLNYRNALAKKLGFEVLSKTPEERAKDIQSGEIKRQKLPSEFDPSEDTVHVRDGEDNSDFLQLFSDWLGEGWKPLPSTYRRSFTGLFPLCDKDGYELYGFTPIREDYASPDTDEFKFFNFDEDDIPF